MGIVARKPDFSSVQSDQRLCYSLSYNYDSLTSHMQNFNILASLCSQADWFECN